MWSNYRVVALLFILVTASACTSGSDMLRTLVKMYEEEHPPPAPYLAPKEQEAVVCSEIGESSLTALAYGELTVEQTVQAVVRQFPVAETAIEKKGDQQGTLSWQYDTRLYSASFQDNILARTGVLWNEIHPTLEDVIRCFGAPDLYEAVYERDIQPALRVALWYPDIGMIVTSLTYHASAHPPAVSRRLKMSGMIVTKPGTAEEMVVSSGNIRRILARRLRLVKSWPGSIEAIETISCYENPELCP